MSHDAFFTWMLPLGLAACGWLYALWARREYGRNMDRADRLRAELGAPPAE